MMLFDKVIAADTPDKAQQVTTELFKTLTGVDDLSKVFIWAIGIGALMAFGVITYAGVLWSLSGGGEEKHKAQEMLKGAAYGLIILVGAYVILWTINPQILGGS